jgi:hypothetical protein
MGQRCDIQIVLPKMMFDELTSQVIEEGSTDLESLFHNLSAITFDDNVILMAKGFGMGMSVEDELAELLADIDSSIPEHGMAVLVDSASDDIASVYGDPISSEIYTYAALIDIEEWEQRQWDSLSADKKNEVSLLVAESLEANGVNINLSELMLNGAIQNKIKLLLSLDPNATKSALDNAMEINMSELVPDPFAHTTGPK